MNTGSPRRWNVSGGSAVVLLATIVGCMIAFAAVSVVVWPHSAEAQPAPTSTLTFETPTPVVTTAPPLDHFSCYEAHQGTAPRMSVTLEDAFGPSTVEVGRPKRLCAPADKNGEDPTAPADLDHLTGYLINQTSPFERRRGVVITNQFGTFSLNVLRPDFLLVPSAKGVGVAPPPLEPVLVDHFKCYRVSGGRLRRPGIGIVNQFESFTADIRKPVRLCLPADKNGEGLTEPQAPLMCYAIRRRFVPPPGAVLVDNQFGPHPDELELRRVTELCVPVRPSMEQTPTPAATPTVAEATASATEAATPTETATESPTPTETASAEPTATDTGTPLATETPTPTATPNCAGGPCTAGGDCTTGFCDMGVCQQVFAGGMCVCGGDCTSGFCDNGICQPVAAGGTCGGGGDCTSGFCDGGVCQQSVAGGSCAVGGDCTTGFCDGNVCQAVCAGGSCVVGGDCTSGSCVAGACAPNDFGGPCTCGGDCAPVPFCDAGTCG